ncbi:MAG: DNA polymerase III subunit gamma/tau [Gloeobacteraceae cyanobacterium ES-bin-316]|nr:DNA polymerase III subunit gamma/tau [Ferruginibacter sp.]
MDKFIVSARKYRPQNFSTVVGQAHITTTLKNAINNNQLAHAFLFCGPRGVGKTTCARILAKTINCENRTPEGEACNNCNSCVSFDAGTSLNIHELDAASNNSVDDIRSLVEQVRFAPQAGRYKVYIVDEVHMLSASAFNAFLKTLEEPPPYAIFILATTEKHKILPTILSRCQIFDFKRITTNDTIVHLQEICEKESIKAEKAALHVIAQKSEGCMRDSLSILDKIVSFTDGKLTYSNTLEHLNILDEDYYFKLLEHLLQQQLSDVLLLLDNILQKGFEADSFLEGFTEFVRNLLVSKDPRAIALLEVAEDFKEKYLVWSQKTEMGWILATLNILNEAGMGYKMARNKRLFTEMVLIKLSYLNQALDLQQSSDGISKKKRSDEARPVAFRALTISSLRVETTPLPAKLKQVAPTTPTASLVVEEPKQSYIAPTEHKPAPSKNIAATTTLGSLKSIREKLAKENNLPVFNSKPLTMEELDKAWKQYVSTLKKNKNHSSVSIFNMARLEIVDENCFNIFTANNMQQKFIEVERPGLIEHLMQYFNNRNISYKIVLSQEEKEDASTEKALTTKQKYQLMIERYPNIKILKDRIRLELDY